MPAGGQRATAAVSGQAAGAGGEELDDFRRRHERVGDHFARGGSQRRDELAVELGDQHRLTGNGGAVELGEAAQCAGIGFAGGADGDGK